MYPIPSAFLLDGITFTTNTVSEKMKPNSVTDVAIYIKSAREVFPNPKEVLYQNSAVWLVEFSCAIDTKSFDGNYS